MVVGVQKACLSREGAKNEIDFQCLHGESAEKIRYEDLRQEREIHHEDSLRLRVHERASHRGKEHPVERLRRAIHLEERKIHQWYRKEIISDMSSLGSSMVRTER